MWFTVLSCILLCSTFKSLVNGFKIESLSGWVGKFTVKKIVNYKKLCESQRIILYLTYFH